MGMLEFRVPLDDYLKMSSGFKERVDPITGAKGTPHRGMDYGVKFDSVTKTKTEVLASERGRVVRAAFDVTRQATDGDYVVGDLYILDLKDGGAR